MTQQLTVILVPHTHWDREWYLTFQQFRIRLVQAVDKLLHILDSDDTFSHFMLDGQTIVLDDYLEIQPEQEERLRKHVRSGRVLVGPWYVQPDEFLVSGESLIRNLQIGLRQARDFGNPMYVGYVPDSFGHIAQLPQIFQGVGIDNAVFWRGVGTEARTSEFLWASPDGNSVFVAHLADPIGYSNARQMPLDPKEFVTRVELLTANLLPKANTNILLFMNGSDHLEIQEGLPATIRAANELMRSIDPTRQEMLTQFESEEEQAKRYDSLSVQIGTLPHYIESTRQKIPFDSLQTLTGELRNGRYSPLLVSVLSSRMWIKQQNTAIEHLLERWVEPLTAWAASTGATYPQGLIRVAWRYLLQNHPHDSICGCSLDQVHRENAVRFAQSQQIAEQLIQQAMQQLVHATDTRAPFPAPHESYEPVPVVVFNPAPGPRTEKVRIEVQLPGSLQNAVIVDARGIPLPYHIVKRWRQEIGSSPFAREMLATAIAFSGITTSSQLVQMAHSTIMSALGQGYESYVMSRVHIGREKSGPQSNTPDDPQLAQSGVVYIEIMIAPQGRVTIDEQETADAGQHILNLLANENIHTLEISLVDQARETIDFLAADLPAYGLKTFWLYPRGLGEQTGKAELQKSPLIAQRNSIENEFYRVEANVQNGTLTVTDKTMGVVYSGLNRLVDGGDVGDLYNYSPPLQDALISELIEPPTIEVIEEQPVSVTLHISGKMALPASCTESRQGRSSETVVCAIASDVTLFPSVQRITIHTSVENNAKDHRLRVLFPVPFKTETASAEGTFEVRTRPVALPVPADVEQWSEAPVNVFPQKRFVDVSTGEHGLAVLNRGLPEYEVVESGSGIDMEHPMAVALTLLRCVEWLSRGDLATRRGHAGPMEYTPEAQCLGKQTFDYALVPHSGTWETNETLVLHEAQAFNIPIATSAVVTEQHSGQLPALAALVAIEPTTLVVSAVKRSLNGRGLIVRVYNPLNSTVSAKLKPGVAFTHAFMTNLLEERQTLIEPSSHDAQTIEITVRSGGIATLLFE
jgi:alpha-mannosidase